MNHLHDYGQSHERANEYFVQLGKELIFILRQELDALAILTKFLGLVTMSVIKTQDIAHINKAKQ